MFQWDLVYHCKFGGLKPTMFYCWQASQIEKQSQQRHQNNLNGRSFCSKGIWHGGDQTLKSHFSWEVMLPFFLFYFFLFRKVKIYWIKGAKLCWRSDKKIQRVFFSSIRVFLLFFLLFVLVKLFLYLLIHPTIIFLFDLFFCIVLIF